MIENGPTVTRRVHAGKGRRTAAAKRLFRYFSSGCPDAALAKTEALGYGTAIVKPGENPWRDRDANCRISRC